MNAAPEPDPRKPMTFWAAVSLGMGAMIGAGIFALLGGSGKHRGKRGLPVLHGGRRDRPF